MDGLVSSTARIQLHVVCARRSIMPRVNGCGRAVHLQSEYKIHLKVAMCERAFYECALIQPGRLKLSCPSPT